MTSLFPSGQFRDVSIARWRPRVFVEGLGHAGAAGRAEALGVTRRDGHGMVVDISINVNPGLINHGLLIGGVLLQ